MTKQQTDAGRDEHAEAIERMEIADKARSILGLPTRHARDIYNGHLTGALPRNKPMKLDEPLPRFARLVIAVRAAIRGWNDPSVQHMVERNKQLDLWRAVEGMA